MASEKVALTWEESKIRSKAISNISYQLKLNVQPGDFFWGESTATFTVSSLDTPLWIDLRVQQINLLKVNGVVAEVQARAGKLQLPGLVVGQNEVYVEYQGKYAIDGLGLHKFLDKEDGEFYLYTQFEAFRANRTFPCFDQPDLKATLELQVKAPSKWTVISADKPLAIRPYEGTDQWVYQEGGVSEQNLTDFGKTPKISTYLYSLCAGPYSEFRFDDNETGIPLGLYCRKTQAKYLVPERYFKWTVEGLKFYNEFFDYPYPYPKYDQVFVPEFNFGAMENVGCVTYRDQYIFKDEPSQVQLVRVCDTFHHEMAHMWFGNLVTMKWWDDLWLNESFATFMSHLCTSTVFAQEFPQVWQEFLGGKGWGYSTDQMSTTHPIHTIVNDTDETETNFDGISYSKGSSVLKQLYFLVGHDVFRNAIVKYMKAFEFSNAVFDDLINFISAESQSAGQTINLQEWANMWVKTAGLNQLQADFSSENGLITEFRILQSACTPQYATLRFHQIIIELFDENMQSMGQHSITVLPQETTILPDLQNTKAPSAVILNVGDWGYCKVVLDPATLQRLQTGLSQIPDPLTRQVIWRALWDMVRDIKISAVEFLELAANAVSQENEASIANYVLEISTTALGYYIPFCQEKDEIAHQLFEVVMQKVRGARSKDEGLIYQQRLRNFMVKEEDVMLGVKWVRDGETGIEGFVIGQQARWGIIQKYATLTAEAQTLVAEERQRDPSDQGELAEIFCSGAYPDPQLKQRAYDRIINEIDSLSNYQRDHIMLGFNRGRQRALLEPYFERYYEDARRILAQNSLEAAVAYFTNMLPAYADDELVIERTNQLLAEIPQQEKYEVIRKTREEIDMLVKFKEGKALSERVLASRRGQ